ncbi:MAG: toast rack family protein [Halanaerobiales bacterium]
MSKEKRSQISAGILLIGLGIIFLLNTIGVIRGVNWSLLLDFWPVIIIIIGLDIILKNTKLWWLTSVVLVSLVLALFLINNGSGISTNGYQYNLPFISQSDSAVYKQDLSLDEDINQLEVKVDFAAGRLSFSRVEDLTNLFESHLQYNQGRPNFDYHIEDKYGYLSIEEKEKNQRWLNISGRNEWSLKLNPNIPLEITVNSGAGDFNFDLEDLIITNISLNSGAGNVMLRLGEITETVKINSAAGNIDIYLPENKAVKIRALGVIRQNNFTDLGLIRKADNIFQTKDYQEGDDGIEIEINTSVSRTNLNFY